MARIKINATTRENTKKLRKLVSEGFIPAVAYDQKNNSSNIVLETGDFEKIAPMIDETTIIELQIDDKETHLALMKDVQTDVRNNRIQHISFMILDPNRVSDYKVAIIFEGISPAVKNNIGIFVPVKNSIELRGLLKDVPESLIVDISNLNEVGDRIYSKTLDLPKTMNLVHEDDINLILATIRPFQKLEELVTTTATEDETEEEGEETASTDTEESTEA